MSATINKIKIVGSDNKSRSISNPADESARAARRLANTDLKPLIEASHTVKGLIEQSAVKNPVAVELTLTTQSGKVETVTLPVNLIMTLDSMYTPEEIKVTGWTDEA